MTVNKISGFCENCFHFKMFFYTDNHKEIPEKEGECRLNPPIFVDKYVNGSTCKTTYIFEFPTVSTFSGYCSRFKR